MHVHRIFLLLDILQESVLGVGHLTRLTALAKVKVRKAKEIRAEMFRNRVGP
jgi:hypothetical protein